MSVCIKSQSLVAIKIEDDKMTVSATLQDSGNHIRFFGGCIPRLKYHKSIESFLYTFTRNLFLTHVSGSSTDKLHNKLIYSPTYSRYHFSFTLYRFFPENANFRNSKENLKTKFRWMFIKYSWKCESENKISA